MKSLQLLLVLLLSLYSSEVLAQEKITVPLTHPGKPGIIELTMVTGDLRIIGSNVQDVTLEYDGDESLQRKRKDPPPGMRRISSGMFELQVHELDNRIQVGTLVPNAVNKMIVRVPESFSVRISLTNGKGITVENLNGEMEISTVDADIHLKNVSGSASVNTVSGKITADFRSISNNGPMGFSNVQGDIDIALPARSGITAKLRSEWGEIFTDFDIQIDQNSRGGSGSAAGMYPLTRNKGVSGTINGGGSEFMIQTLRGDIYIRKR